MIFDIFVQFQKIFEIEQKLKPGDALLHDQGRSSGDFVSNFQPLYIKNYLI